MTGAAARTDVIPPTTAELHAALGHSTSAWPQIIIGMEELFGSLTLVWRTSELAFGRMCLVQRQGKTILYLMPMAGQLLVGVVLNGYAFQTAMRSDLRPAIKQMLADTKPTGEGRGIRFTVKSEADIAEVLTLAQCVVAAEE